VGRKETSTLSLAQIIGGFFKELWLTSLLPTQRSFLLQKTLSLITKSHSPMGVAHHLKQDLRTRMYLLSLQYQDITEQIDEWLRISYPLE
jgi:hypothetical protein